MRKSRSFFILIVLLVFALSVGLTGCFRTGKGRFIPIDYNNYLPSLAPAMKIYANKGVYLMEINNNAPETTVSTYYSPDHGIIYGNSRSGFAGIGGRSLASNFWYCIQRALVSVNMRVSSIDDPDLYSPGVEFTIQAMNDEHFQWVVQVYSKGAVIFSKLYNVTEPPLPLDERTKQNLGARAYKMVTKTIETVFLDREFKAAFDKATL